MKKTLTAIALTLTAIAPQAASTASQSAVEAFLEKGNLSCQAERKSLRTPEEQRAFFKKRGLSALIKKSGKKNVIETGDVSGPRALFSFTSDTDIEVIAQNVVGVTSSNQNLGEKLHRVNGVKANKPLLKIKNNTFVHLPEEDAFLTANVSFSCGYGSCGINDFIIVTCK